MITQKILWFSFSEQSFFSNEQMIIEVYDDNKSLSLRAIEILAQREMQILVTGASGFLGRNLVKEGLRIISVISINTGFTKIKIMLR